ncbi:MAG TPA: hypothetical protein PKZ36_03295 [Candidatus Paceibacterota bacterium]|nr:hypothetical protein [Candidatus Paceibacterota bacterium]HPT18402.1 hypothetical protein [Candidatus Paceibacterota bacterium]
MIKRICFSSLLLISLFFFPIYISVILALLGAFLFSFYWEMVVLFFISDLLLGVKETRFLNLLLVSTVVSFAVLLLIEFTKKKLKFYNKE